MNEENQTAGTLLRAALKAEGIPSSWDGHASAGCFWVEILGGDGSRIWINGANRRENELGYPLSEHDGWQAFHYPGEDDEGTALYRSLLADIHADTAGVIAAVMRFAEDWPGFLPAQDPERDITEPDSEVRVRLTVTESIEFEFESDVRVPASVAGDRAGLERFLIEHEDLWIRDLDPFRSFVDVRERRLDRVALAA